MLFTLSFMCPKIIMMCVVIKTRCVCIVHKAVNEYIYIYNLSGDPKFITWLIY